MKKLLELLKGKKSYIVSSATILYALLVVGWQGGDWMQAQKLILGALGLAALRNGMK